MTTSETPDVADNAPAPVSPSAPPASTASTPAPSLKPALCFAVGVTGHRHVRLQSADLERLQTTVAALLNRVQAAATDVAHQHADRFASSSTQLRLVSALADGADTLVAEAALASGQNTRNHRGKNQ